MALADIARRAGLKFDKALIMADVMVGLEPVREVKTVTDPYGV